MAAALEERLSDVGAGGGGGGAGGTGTATATEATGTGVIGGGVGVEEEGNRAARLPRWSRQEILVLIQGKRVAENRVRRGLGFGSGQVEPKWASVSSYCKRHGVNRGPVQCRKRWSNLAGDFKKIKEWETSNSNSNSRRESFWVMRNDLRRERKLPGFFDREVYDILLDSTSSSSSLPLPDNSSSLLVLPPPPPPPEPEDDQDTETEELVFDSARTGAAADDALFSDFEPSPPTTSTKQYNPPPPPPFTDFTDKQHPPQPTSTSAQGASHVKQPPKNPEVGTATQEGRKRKRLATDGEEETYLENQLIKTLERNGNMLSSQLEIQNMNFRLDREQRKDHGNSLIAVLNKLADALGRIADKL